MGTFNEHAPDMMYCSEGEELLHSYVDADLAIADQPKLFAHLAECESCRLQLDSILLFRRQIRLERIVVPAEVDASFMLLLEKKRQESTVESVKHERRPVWRRNLYLSRGVATLLALLLVAVGFTLPRVPVVHDVTPVVLGHQESVDLIESGTRSEPVYVFYPGVTVEGERE